MFSIRQHKTETCRDAKVVALSPTACNEIMVWWAEDSDLTFDPTPEEPHAPSHSTLLHQKYATFPGKNNISRFTFDPTPLFPVHIRPYPTFPGSHSTLPHCSRFTFPVHIRPYPTFPGSHSTLPHMRPNASRFKFDPTSNQPSVNQPPLNKYIHWYQINQPPFEQLHSLVSNQPGPP